MRELIEYDHHMSQETVMELDVIVQFVSQYSPEFINKSSPARLFL